MAKLLAMLGALAITALCAVVAVYAMPLLLHWQTMVAASLLFYAVIYVVSVRKKRQAAREAIADKSAPYPARSFREP
jgi:hypothetical protein